MSDSSSSLDESARAMTIRLRSSRADILSRSRGRSKSTSQSRSRSPLKSSSRYDSASGSACPGSAFMGDWFEHLILSRYDYREPVFAKTTPSLLKKFCYDLEQESNVFALSVEILEKFYYANIATNCRGENEIWIACVCLLIANKYVENAIALKIEQVVPYVKNLTGCQGYPNIEQIEFHILNTIEPKVPLITKMDDMIKVVVRFCREYHLNEVSLLQCCKGILISLYELWNDFFIELKTSYNQNNGTLSDFKILVTNKVYLPAGVIIAAIRLGYYTLGLSTENVIQMFSSVSKIDKDHLNTLSTRIMLFEQKYSLVA